MVRRWPIAALAAGLLIVGVCATSQEFDREKSAREYVQFLVLQLDQWSREFPQQFYAAMMKPPVDSAKMSEAAKNGAAEFSDAIHMLAALSKSSDLLTNAEFRKQVEKTVATTKEMNQAMSMQRFPAVVQSSWDQIRSTLNNLARVYKVQTLAVLDAPEGADRKGKGASGAAPKMTGTVAGGIAGYIVDRECSKRGKGMWTNAECIARCVRDGDKLVVATDDGKVYQISNPDKIAPESYGQVVTLLGKVDGDTITVDTLK